MGNEDFVGRYEFNSLKEEVQEIKKDMLENQKLLQSIDKKIDIIDNKVSETEKTDKLRLDPLENRVKELEENQKWLRKTVTNSIITVVIGAIIFVIKMMK